MNSKPVSAKLIETGLFPLGDGVWARCGRDELADKLRTVDLLASDVDECMFPFIGQALASRHVLNSTFRSIRTFSDAAFAMRMAVRAGELVAEMHRQKLSGRAQNSPLIKKFEQFVMDVPVEFFHESARELARRHYPGMPETLAYFMERGAQVGMISLGIDLFLDSVLDMLLSEHGLGVSFADCTLTCDNEGLFSGYDPEMTLLVPEDKYRLLCARIEEFGARVPLVVGHDRDDTGLFGAARQAGGIAVGFNPIPETYSFLDAAVFAPDWFGLLAFLRDLIDN